MARAPAMTGSLPDGLDETYGAYFQRLLDSIDRDVERYKTLVSVALLAPREAVTEEVWRRAVGSVPGSSKRFNRDFNGAYASNLEGVVEDGRPALWVHGHTHDSCDYTLGDTGVVCNPRGYDDENTAFDRQLVVEVRT